MYRRAYVFKLLPTHRLKALDDTRFHAALLYNHCIALHKRYYRLYKGIVAQQKAADQSLKKSAFLSAYQLKLHLTKLKKRTNPIWGNLPSQTIQDVVERIDKGFSLFFSVRKKGNTRIQPPSFRKASKYSSFTLKQKAWRIEQGEALAVPMGKRQTTCPQLVLNLRNKHGKLTEYAYKFRQSRAIEGAIKTVTLKRDRVGDWWVVFSCAKESNFTNPEKYVASGKSAGVDFGLATFLTRSDEVTHQNPHFFKRGLRKLRQANRHLSGKKPGSNRRKKARVRLARVHRSIVNQRTAYQWKEANKLAKSFDVLCLEDLDMRGMKARWGRKVSDLAFSDFVQKLKVVFAKHDKELVQVSRWFAATKLCYGCGWKNEKLGLKDRVWTCGGCGSTHNRDINAAKNIHREGLRILAEKKTGADCAPVRERQRKTGKKDASLGASLAAATAESPFL